MRKLIYIFLCLSIILASCSKEVDDSRNVPEGMTEVLFSIPKIYSDGGNMPQTKADSEFLEGKSISKLPVGSTIWLNYSWKNDEGYETHEVKPYIIIKNATVTPNPKNIATRNRPKCPILAGFPIPKGAGKNAANKRTGKHLSSALANRFAILRENHIL